MQSDYVRSTTRITLATLLFLAFSLAQATSIRVAQESAAGAGDFDANVLGFIDTFDTGLTMAGFYQYNNPNGASYNGELNGGPLPISSLTQSFFVNASDGLHYVTLHDNPNDGPGGSTRMTTTLLGGAGGAAAFTVGDDPGEGISISDAGGDRMFDTVHGWIDCCTDGYAIGSLLITDVLLAVFDVVPTGVDRWQSTGVVTPDLALVLEPGRRVRYDFIAEAPEPGTLALLGIGILGFGYRARRRASPVQ